MLPLASSRVSMARHPTLGCLKNSKNQGELALDSNSKEKSNRFTSPSLRIKALHLDFADSLLK